MSHYKRAHPSTQSHSRTHPEPLLRGSFDDISQACHRSLRVKYPDVRNFHMCKDIDLAILATHHSKSDGMNASATRKPPIGALERERESCT